MNSQDNTPFEQPEQRFGSVVNEIALYSGKFSTLNNSVKPLKVIETSLEMAAYTLGVKRPLGFVPTMGSLHEGHMALVHQSDSENQTTCVSIFVNPKQFGPCDDFDQYPRSLQSDLMRLEEAGVKSVFVPSAKEMYPSGFDTTVSVGRLSDKLEGQFRPDHFTGVSTVVTKLLAITRPDKAYFGQKDAQQCFVIQRLNADLHLGVDIIISPTVRAPDGLALSSRNTYLRPKERLASTALYHSLCIARDRWESGITDPSVIKKQMWGIFEDEPLANVEYISIACIDTLEEIDQIDPPVLVSLAVRIGKTRLIDNILL